MGALTRNPRYQRVIPALHGAPKASPSVRDDGARSCGDLDRRTARKRCHGGKSNLKGTPSLSKAALGLFGVANALHEVLPLVLVGAGPVAAGTSPLDSSRKRDERLFQPACAGLH